MKQIMNLRLFEDGGGAGSAPGQNGNAGNGNGGQNTAGENGREASFSFAQAEEIANARAHRAEQAALRSYFQQQGMTQEQVQQALNDFKQRQKENQPDMGKIQKERDDALKELEQMKNEKLLVSKGVKAEDLDYVAFKVSKLVDDKTDFQKAAEKFLKENPRFTGQTYQVSTGVSSGSASPGVRAKNEQINDIIRGAFGR